MKLYLLHQETNRKPNSYHNVVVCAESEEAARKINPCGFEWAVEQSWVEPKDIEVTYLGEAGSHMIKDDVICCDFRPY